MKRWMGWLLCLALLLQSCPLSALAEGRVLSGKALYAANALAGQARGAPTWHEGMLPEASWNAEQLDAWLDDVLDHALYSVRNTFSDLEVTLAKIEAQDPTLYAALTQGDNAAHFKRASALALEAEALRERLRATRDLCVMKADAIAANIDSLSADGVSARDQAMSSRRIEKAAAELRNARDEVLNGYEAWFDQIAGWQRLFALSTCLDDDRLVVVARKRRADEPTDALVSAVEGAYEGQGGIG